MHGGISDWMWQNDGVSKREKQAVSRDEGFFWWWMLCQRSQRGWTMMVVVGVVGYYRRIDRRWLGSSWPRVVRLERDERVGW